jgi:hypothetical protein
MEKRRSKEDVTPVMKVTILSLSFSTLTNMKRRRKRSKNSTFEK